MAHSEPISTGPEILADPGPLTRFGFWPGLFCRTVLTHLRIDPGVVEHIRNLSRRGSIVYVMRYRSLVDYFLLAHLLMREGLPLPEFVSNVSTLWLRPLREIAAILWRRIRTGGLVRRREVKHVEDLDCCQRLVQQGRPVLIFMRSRAPRVPLSASRRTALRRVRSGTDYLREIVHATWGTDQAVFLVPLAVLRGRGYRRKEWKLATIVYSVQETPGEIKRVFSLIWNARETSVIVGRHIEVSAFARAHQSEGEERVVRRLARALQIFLHREERVVWGPTLLPKRRVRQLTLQGADLAALIRRTAIARNVPESQVWRHAEKLFDEMAANFKGGYFGVLEFAFNRIWPRMFEGLEYRGLDKVVATMKQHPIVLVPCHRSHFDYLILSYLFHTNYLSPPHIAAGDNMAFWPLAPFFRGAGAYFIRRSFEGDDLYKMVFRKYLTFLIREGYTQEFFIEGGRSRTGKILTPKLGMLSAILNTYLEGVRRDIYFVPVSIYYERIVEEETYKRELTGAQKERESMFALLRARSALRQRYGTVYVTFAEPISLEQALGPAKQRFAEGSALPVVEQEKRRFVQKLGFRILRDVNAVTVAGASSVAATVLLSSPHAAWRYDQFLDGAHALVALLRRQGVQLSGFLSRTEDDFKESVAFLEASQLVQRKPDDAEVILVPAEKRLTLDFYKNNSIHFFLLPALLTRALSTGVRGAALHAEIRWWLDLYRWEFALPERTALAGDIERWLQYFRQQGVLGADGPDALVTDHPLVRVAGGILDNFCEAYWVVARAIAQLEAAGMTQKAFLEGAQKSYTTSLLVGEVRRPEGNTVVTLGNALNRFAELGLVALGHATRSRDRRVLRGPEFQNLDHLMNRLAANLSGA
jgi:glycerol-3-phosphate O-acyltransferase